MKGKAAGAHCKSIDHIDIAGSAGRTRTRELAIMIAIVPRFKLGARIENRLDFQEAQKGSNERVPSPRIGRSAACRRLARASRCCGPSESEH